MQNQYTWICYTGVDGSIWYLSGPAKPVAGAQDGMILQKHMGLMAPFEHLELRGARQDGATWTDAVYDVGEIMFSLEASGIAPQNIRNVIRQWISAWDPQVGNPGHPARPGVLSVFTPDMGEWWANVRLGKNISDMFAKDYTFSGKANFTWSMKNFDAFWYGVDSTSTFAIAYSSAADNFSLYNNQPSLSNSWTQVYSTTSAGTYGVENQGTGLFGATATAASQWISNGVLTQAVVANLYTTGSATDNQTVFIQLAGATFHDLIDFIVPGTFFDIWARVQNNSGVLTGIRLRIGFNTMTLSYFIAGAETDWFTIPLIIPPHWGESFTLMVGSDVSPNEFRILRNGFVIWKFTDWNQVSSRGASFRGWGFGAQTAIVAGQVIVPPPIVFWAAADNLSSTQSGLCPLTNFGDVPAWPRFLCYGPGTFAFTNPITGNTVSIGPIVDDQVVLITTEPRLRSVVDLTPTQPAQQLNVYQQLLSNLISFATNGNVPPLLQKFESLFGILPPQGNLYSLMSGRWTQPIPGAAYGVQPTTYNIPVSITNGSPQSKVVAAITPRRRWPL